MNVKKDLTWEFQNTKLMEIKRLNCNLTRQGGILMCGLTTDL